MNNFLSCKSLSESLDLPMETLSQSDDKQSFLFTPLSSGTLKFFKPSEFSKLQVAEFCKHAEEMSVFLTQMGSLKKRYAQYQSALDYQLIIVGSGLGAA